MTNEISIRGEHIRLCASRLTYCLSLQANSLNAWRSWKLGPRHPFPQCRFALMVLPTHWNPTANHLRWLILRSCRHPPSQHQHDTITLLKELWSIHTSPWRLCWWETHLMPNGWVVSLYAACSGEEIICYLPPFREPKTTIAVKGCSYNLAVPTLTQGEGRSLLPTFPKGSRVFTIPKKGTEPYSSDLIPPQRRMRRLITTRIITFL